MIYAAPGAAGAKIAYKARYDNFIGGKFVAPVKGQYFDVITPISGTVTRGQHVPAPKTLIWRWTLPMLRPTPGARPMPPAAPMCC